MKKALIIVESPAKIKTLKKILGPRYAVESSVGHIRDLPKKGFGIDIKDDFEPNYEVLEDKKEVIAKLKKAAKEVEIVYLFWMVSEKSGIPQNSSWDIKLAGI